MTLTQEHIGYIIKDLHSRGLIVEEVQDELIDHVCAAVEERMLNGMRFADAYAEVILAFGNDSGLQHTQHQIVKSDNKSTPHMLRNYFTIAYRNLKKQSFYTLINVLGLAVGISSCLLIVAYILHETSYDAHYKDTDRIYRVESEIKFGPNHLMLAVSPGPLADAFRTDCAEVETIGRFWNDGSLLIKRTDQNIKETRAIYADSSVFRVFNFPFIEGNPATALRDPYTMVVSRSTAEKYFPGESAIGQSLIVENKDNYKIVGIYEDMPTTGHFRFDLMLALVTVPYNRDPQWLSNNFSTYVKLHAGTSAAQLEARFPAMVDKYAGPEAKAALGGEFTMDKFRASGNKLEWTLRPLREIHLHSDRIGEIGTNSDITYIYLFGAIAGFILLIACINFMNLSTARSANRAKEVGVRKVMGSLRPHLVRQFLTESILLSAFSFVLALGLVWLALPYFNDLAGFTISLPWTDGIVWLALATGAVVVGTLAGLYPAFFLSAFNPANVLKGNLSLGMKSGLVRSTLVVIQFVVSIALIIGTIAVNQQLNFIQQKKIGFNKDQVIVIKDAYGMADQLKSFKTEVMKDSRIISGTISGFLPVAGTNRNDNTYWPDGVQPTQENLVSIQCWRVDEDYLKTLGMNIKNGRDFSLDFPSDSSGVILNEAALVLFGITGDPIGQRINTWGRNGPDSKNPRRYTVIGVVENFHFESLRQSITPLAFFLEKSIGLISFRFEAQHTAEVIQNIQSTWEKMAPGLPFAYSFLDEDFQRMYIAEQRLGKIFLLFAGLAIVIASLGLFALTAFTAEQRTKEIGIRKVMGASVTSIIFLLSREFGRLIIIAFILAVPLAWYGISEWLASYTYRVTIGVPIYALAGVLAFVIAWLTMGYQSFRAATADPVKSLRTE